jgi:ATP adenylyltransferase/5',5'''-P-1,P-4-tetraphosphate phosphorylase II
MEEDTVTRCDRIEEHIYNLLNGEGDEVYDENITITLSEDKESVIVTDDFNDNTETFKISDYKGLVYLVIAIDGFLYNN